MSEGINYEPIDAFATLGDVIGHAGVNALAGLLQMRM
jgi:hypothetical protein